MVWGLAESVLVHFARTYLYFDRLCKARNNKTSDAEMKRKETQQIKCNNSEASFAKIIFFVISAFLVPAGFIYNF